MGFIGSLSGVKFAVVCILLCVSAVCIAVIIAGILAAILVEFSGRLKIKRLNKMVDSYSRMLQDQD